MQDLSAFLTGSAPKALNHCKGVGRPDGRGEVKGEGGKVSASSHCRQEEGRMGCWRGG